MCLFSLLTLYFEYKCGEVKNALSVLVPPKPIEGAAKEEGLQEIVEGHVVVLNCQMHAVPTPRVSWYKDSLPLSFDAEQVTSQVLR